ncbi:MAG: cytochrome c oxidase assembly protein, partial [Thermodesulfobacteriota bacterium]
MDPVTRAALESFRFDPWIVAALLATGLVYLRGWRALHAQMPSRFTAARLAAFLAGLAALLAAVASPLDAFAPFLLTVHMVQHLLITMVAAPLLLLGAPQMPLLRGLPAGFTRGALGPFLAAPELRALGRWLTHPVPCLAAFVATTWLWHAPALYERALRAEGWHALEHASFLGAALLFWWPVILPWPSVARWPRWTVIPYLVIADLANTALSALLSFAESVLYPTYAAAPRLAGTTALGDQSAAGALMWLTSSLCYLAPAGAIAIRLLSPPLARPGAAPDEARRDAHAAA